MTSSIARLIALDSVNSTSSYLAGIAETMPHGTVVSAYAQTAGRGQRGNSWESEPGANLTFSMLLRPTASVPPSSSAFRRLWLSASPPHSAIISPTRQCV